MSNRSILCVDDDPSVLRALRSLLGNLGMKYQVLIAESGEEALEVIRRIHEDGRELAVIIADCMMPGMRGDELLARVHEVDPTSMKIMLTGQSDFVAVKKSINKANLFSYIEKPFSNDDLLLTVKTACVTHKTRSDLAAENIMLKAKLKQLESILADNGIAIQ
jgi:DNA-binding NtrC family response regulator